MGFGAPCKFNLICVIIKFRFSPISTFSPSQILVYGWSEKLVDIFPPIGRRGKEEIQI